MNSNGSPSARRSSSARSGPSPTTTKRASGKALEDRRRRVDEHALVLLLDETRDVADDAAVVRAALDVEAREVEAERDHDSSAAVTLAIGLGRVDHLRPRQPASAPQRSAADVVAARQLGRVVRDENPRHPRDARREERERPDVDDVHDPRAQRAQLADEVREQRAAPSVRGSYGPQLGEPGERRERLRLRMDHDGGLVQPVQELLEVALDGAPRGGLVQVRDHASTSSRTAAKPSAVRSQVKRRRLLEPAPPQVARRGPSSASTRLSAAAIASASTRIAEQAGLADDLRDRRSGRSPRPARRRRAPRASW